MNENAWHEDDSLWDKIGGFLFSEQSYLKAPVQVDFILSAGGISPGMQVLDLCCGTGRHSVEMAGRGITVTGVDRTGSYILKARERAAEAGVDAEFIVGDMREYHRPDFYDAVINIFTSFGYFRDRKDDRKVLDNVRNSLKPGGRFIIDIMSKEILAKFIDDRRWEEVDDTVVLQESRVSDNWTWVESDWTILENGRYEKITIAHRIYSGYELSGLIEESGLKVLEVFGGFDGSPYDSSAQRLIIIAEKR